MILDSLKYFFYFIRFNSYIFLKQCKGKLIFFCSMTVERKNLINFFPFFQVGPLTEPARIHCLCNHLTAFGAGFAVPMNTINLNNSAFTNLDSNPIVFATMVSMMCLYLLLLIWARKKDKRDAILVKTSFALFLWQQPWIFICRTLLEFHFNSLHQEKKYCRFFYNKFIYIKSNENLTYDTRMSSACSFIQS